MGIGDVPLNRDDETVRENTPLVDRFARRIGRLD
jgi:hypothetical protein